MSRVSIFYDAGKSLSPRILLKIELIRDRLSLRKRSHLIINLQPLTEELSRYTKLITHYYYTSLNLTPPAPPASLAPSIIVNLILHKYLLVILD